MNQIDPKMIQSFAPTGTLRVGINLGNPVLAGLDKTTQKPKGVTIDIANEIGKRSGIPVDLIPFKSAGATVDAIKTGNIDLIFVAIDPVRGADVSYTPPYIQIEGAYMVKGDSALKTNEEVDRSGVEIVVGKGSAYDLYLTREIKNAELQRAPTSPTTVDFFLTEKLEVAAGVKQQLEMDAKRLPNLRLLPGRFMVIEQAMGLPKTRSPEAQAYLKKFVEEMKSSGFVAQSLMRHKIEGAAVAPATPL